VLAREEAGTSSINSDRHTAIAGKPAVTGGIDQDLCLIHKPTALPRAVAA